MEDLNNVPSSGTYGAAITEVNRNFSLIVNAINSLEYATTKSKGIYNNGFTPNTTTLPNSVSGDWCMVLGTGNTFPARIWTYNGTTWAQGGTWNPDGLDLTGYATTAAMNTAIANSLLQATARMGYGEATASNNAYSVSIANYTLPTNGGVVRVKMPTAATGAATLNITNTGAKTILYNGAAVSSQNTWEAQEIISVFYDGTKYIASNSQGGGGDAEKIKYDNSKSGLVSNNVQGALDELGEKIGDVDSVIIPVTVINGSRYIINNGKVAINANASCKRAEPVDVSGFAKVKASFYLEQSYSSVSVFADDNGNVVGDKIVNDGQSYRIFDIPEGATKLYLCTRENPVTGVYDPFGAIGITGKSVTDRLDELDDELTNFEVVTKNLSVPRRGTDRTNFPFVEGRTYRIKTTRTSGTAAISINAYESASGDNFVAINGIPEGQNYAESIYVANSYQYIGLWGADAVGVSVEISWENGRKIELIEDEIDELKEKIFVYDDTGFNPNGESVKTGGGISTNASFTLGQYSLIGTVQTSHNENNISGITCNTALLKAGKTYKVEFDYDTDFDTSMQFRDSSLQNPLRVVSIPEGTGSISVNVTPITNVGVIAFLVPANTTGSFTLTNIHIYEQNDVQWAYDNLSEIIASHDSIDSEGIDLKVSEFAKGQGETDNDVWDKILLFSSVVKSRTIHIDRSMTISRVLLVPSNTTILIEDSTITCGNNFADNVFRGANEDASYVARVEAAATVNDCPTEIEEIENIRILGVGNALITRTDTNNYIGTDYWGWKTINVYFDRLKHAEIGNITFRKTRGWNMCFFFGSDIYIHDVNVYSNNIYNGDGMDFRAGCHHITIENLYGQTRDDNIALHCMKSQGRKTSNNIWPCLCSGYIAAVAATDARACDIHDVKIDGSTKDGRDGGASWHNVMFVARSGTEIYNVSLRNIRTYGPIIEATQAQYGGGAIYFEDFTVPSLDGDRPDNAIHDVCIINASNSDNAQYPTVKSQLKCENIYLKDITTSVSGQVAISLDYPEGFTVIE